MFFKKRKELKELIHLADWGDAEAMFKLGKRYFSGKGVKCDFSRALELLEDSAKKGYVPAYAELGDLYYDGVIDIFDESNRIDRDYEKAAYWFEKAVENTDYDEELFIKLALIYEEGGYGAEPNVERAVKYLLKPAELGDYGAQNALGYCYYLLDDNENALHWKKLAAENGGPAEITSLACLYADLDDYEKAIPLYEKAAEKGDDMAFYWLGECYYNGNGVQKDLAKAEEYYRKAAKFGCLSAKKALKEYFGKANK